jgi:hypothetical protein
MSHPPPAGLLRHGSYGERAAAVGLLLEEPPRDVLGGTYMVVADKFATNASNGGLLDF